MTSGPEAFNRNKTQRGIPTPLGDWRWNMRSAHTTCNLCQVGVDEGRSISTFVLRSYPLVVF